MQTVNVSISINSIPENTQPTGIRPCPRVNCFKHPKNPIDITKKGDYYYSYEINKGERCGLDIFIWNQNDLQVISNPKLTIETKLAGENSDQLQKTINFLEAGDYSFIINIK